MHGRTVKVMNEMLRKGSNVFSVTASENWLAGVYYAILKINRETSTTRFVVLE
jgi:UDP-N-acetylmuramyl pentapeptide synthase